MHTLSLASTLRLIGGLALLTAATSAACSATNGGNQFTAGTGGHGPGVGGSTNTGDPGTGGEIAFDAGVTPDGSFDDAGACAAESKKAEQLPLDMYIMLDQSGSMTDSVSGGGTKWDAVTSAFKTFVNQPGTAGIGVGIQYFPLIPGGMMCSPTCATDADCGAFGPCFFGICFGCAASSNDSCVAADYATPDVEIAALPGSAMGFIKSINAHSPKTNTPTSAALQGAIDHAKAWGTAHPDHVVIDVLATDGDPTECDTDLNNINAIAAAGVSGTPKILTFVIGVGTSLSALNGTAAAGGTGQAFIVDTNQNVNQQFLDALNKIRGAALSCTYLIPVPSKGNPDFSSVNVQYTPGNGGPVVVLPKVKDKNSCPPNGDAWFYDNNAAPKEILLCDATCTKAAADTKGQIDILLGCATIAQ
ncbi:MAG: vWA domain-containing protein [Byssovorax sp.]